MGRRAPWLLGGIDAPGWSPQYVDHGAHPATSPPIIRTLCLFLFHCAAKTTTTTVSGWGFAPMPHATLPKPLSIGWIWQAPFSEPPRCRIRCRVLGAQMDEPFNIVLNSTPMTIDVYGLKSVLVVPEKAESELIGLTKRVRGLEEDFETTESRLLNTSTKLDEASKASDENERYMLTFPL